jgi:hypothetical protein
MEINTAEERFHAYAVTEVVAVSVYVLNQCCVIGGTHPTVLGGGIAETQRQHEIPFLPNLACSNTIRLLCTQRIFSRNVVIESFIRSHHHHKVIYLTEAK